MAEVPLNNPFRSFCDYAEGKPVRPTFTHDSLKRQLDNGLISKEDYEFLGNLLDKLKSDPNILNRVVAFRLAINKVGDLEPTAEEFMEMQDLGCRSYPLTGLDLSSRTLPVVKLNHGVIGGNLKMRFANVDGDVEMNQLTVKGSVDQTGMKSGGNVEQSAMRTGGGILQQEMEVKGDILQAGIVSNGSIDQRGIRARNVYHAIAEVRGHIDMRGAKCEKLDQRCANIDGGTDLEGAQIPTVYQGSPD